MKKTAPAAFNPSDELPLNGLAFNRFNFDEQEWLSKERVYTHLKPHHTFIQVLWGRYEILTPAGSINIQDGDILFIKAARHLQLRTHNDDNHKLMKIRWLELDLRIHGAVDFISMLNLPTKFDGQTAVEIGHVLEESCQEKLASTPHELGFVWKRTQQNLWGFKILHILLKNISIKKDWKDVLHNSNSLNNILAFIHQNYRRKITVEELAKKAGLSAARFFYVFHKNFQRSPLQYIKQLRVTHVADELIQTDKSLQQIAKEAGFSSQFHMSREFRNKHNTPPATYRRNFRGQLEDAFRKANAGYGYEFYKESIRKDGSKLGDLRK